VKFGVVIPTLDEAGAIEGALRSVGPAGPGDGACDFRISGPKTSDSTEIEIVVVDGGSRDATCQRARDLGARVIELPQAPEAGRARQLAAGLAACDADVVLFLHADTRLPSGWREAARAALAEPAVVGGAFRFAFAHEGDGPSPLLRAVEWGARVRSRLFRLPYGDQAIFARRAALERIGGVPQAPIMEDLDLVRALRREGELALLDAPVSTSARRYRDGGVLRTFLRNALALAAWRLGLDRARVARWYRR
jgi:rSAM/selenodomain-associated transferase 2